MKTFSLAALFAFTLSIASAQACPEEYKIMDAHVLTAKELQVTVEAPEGGYTLFQTRTKAIPGVEINISSEVDDGSVYRIRVVDQKRNENGLSTTYEIRETKYWKFPTEVTTKTVTLGCRSGGR